MWRIERCGTVIQARWEFNHGCEGATVPGLGVGPGLCQIGLKDVSQRRHGYDLFEGGNDFFSRRQAQCFGSCLAKGRGRNLGSQS